MATTSPAASELQPVQEQPVEAPRSPEEHSVDRASGEFETAKVFVQEHAAESLQTIQQFGEIANDNEIPEAGAEAAVVTETAKNEISAAAQHAEAQIVTEVNPLPPAVESQQPPSPEGEMKLKELEGVADQARARMSEIFAKLMEMKASGNVLDAGEYETYKKMLDEDPVLNGFVQKLQQEFANEQNDGTVRARAAQIAGEFAEGAQNQQAFAEQMARRGAESLTPGVETTRADAAAGAEAPVEKTTEALDAEEGPVLQGLRAQATELAASMKAAMSFGNFELFDNSLVRLIDVKRQMLIGLMALSNPSDRQKQTIDRLVPEIASLEKEKEIRVETAELKELEKEKKKIEAEIKLFSGGEGEVQTETKKRLSEVEKKIAEKNQKIASLHGQRAAIGSLSGGVETSINPGDVVDNVADTVGKGILDPSQAGLKILDKIIGS